MMIENDEYIVENIGSARANDETFQPTSKFHLILLIRFKNLKNMDLKSIFFLR